MNKTLSQNFEKMFRSKVTALSVIHSNFSVLHFRKTIQILKEAVTKKLLFETIHQTYAKFHLVLPRNKRVETI